MPHPRLGSAITALLLAASILTAASADTPSPLDIGSRKQLFIDHRFIARSEHVTLRANPAEKLGLIRDEHDQPWPGSDHLSRVLEDGGRLSSTSARTA